MIFLSSGARCAPYLYRIVHNLQHLLRGRLKHKHGRWLSLGTTLCAQTFRMLYIRKLLAQLTSTSSFFFHALSLLSSFISRLTSFTCFDSTIFALSKLLNVTIFFFIFHWSDYLPLQSHVVLFLPTPSSLLRPVSHFLQKVLLLKLAFFGVVLHRVLPIQPARYYYTNIVHLLSDHWSPPTFCIHLLISSIKMI